MKVSYFLINTSRLLEPKAFEAHLLTEPCRSAHWLDVQTSAQAELETLLQPLHLDPIIMQDLEDQIHSPSVVAYDNALFLRFPMPLQPGQPRSFLGMVCLPELLVSFHLQDFPELDDAARQLGLHPLSNTTVTAILFHLLDTLFDRNLQSLLTFRHQIHKIAHQLYSEKEEVAITDLLTLKEHLSRLNANLEDQAYCLSVAQRQDDTPLNPQRMRAYFTNLEEKIQHGCRSASRLEKRLSDLHLQYMLELQDKSEHRVRLLTIVSSIILPLTLISSIYGMNFAHMPELQGEYNYYIVLGFMAAIASGLLGIFYWKGWFE
jgi:magnesium transporter